MAPVTATCSKDGTCPTPDGCNAEGGCLKSQPPMRLRVLHLPGEQFLLVLDRVPESLHGNEWGRDMLKTFGEHSRERLPNCGGVIAFSDPVEMEAWYPYG